MKKSDLYREAVMIFGKELVANAVKTLEELGERTDDDVVAGFVLGYLTSAMEVAQLPIEIKKKGEA